MKHAKEKDNFFHRLYLSYIPNKRDNLKQIILKVFFLITLTVFIVSAVYIANYFFIYAQQKLCFFAIQRKLCLWLVIFENTSYLRAVVLIMTGNKLKPFCL